MNREANDALCTLNMIWKWDGDWMTCTGCKRSLIASRDGEELNHAVGCKHADQQHPWRRLREIIAGNQPADELTNEQITAGAAVLGDDGRPIGRNTAIMVADAMRIAGQPAAQSAEKDALVRAARSICERWDRDVPTDCMSEEHKALRDALAQQSGKEQGNG